MKSSTRYFHMKVRIFADFRICISAPLRKNWQVIKKALEKGQVNCQVFP